MLVWLVWCSCYILSHYILLFMQGCDSYESGGEEWRKMGLSVCLCVGVWPRGRGRQDCGKSVLGSLHTPLNEKTHERECSVTRPLCVVLCLNEDDDWGCGYKTLSNMGLTEDTAIASVRAFIHPSIVSCPLTVAGGWTQSQLTLCER